MQDPGPNIGQGKEGHSFLHTREWQQQVSGRSLIALPKLECSVLPEKIRGAMPRRNREVRLRVCLVGQSPLALEYLSAIVHKDPTVEIVRIQSLAAPREDQPPEPIFVIDNCGLQVPLSECIRRLRYHYPKARFVVLDRELGNEDLLRLLWIKIDGFLPYNEVRQSLLAAIHSVALGRLWIPREILREYVQCAREGHLKGSSTSVGLTHREAHILELVKRRLSNKEIAEILQLQESTVKFHLSNIYSKLQVSSRRELIEDGSSRSGLEGLLPALRPSVLKA